MCAIDYLDPADVWSSKDRKARVQHFCDECARVIAAGETYRLFSWLYDGRWTSMKVCPHCSAAGVWLDIACGGWPIGGLREELEEHWAEGYRSVGFGRLLVGQRRAWRGGADPVPDAEEVAALARRMLISKVAA